MGKSRSRSRSRLRKWKTNDWAVRVTLFPGTTFLHINAAKGIKARVLANKRLSYHLQNYWNLDPGCKQQQLSGPVNYRDFRETDQSACKMGLKIVIKNTYLLLIFCYISFAPDTVFFSTYLRSWRRSLFFITIFSPKKATFKCQSCFQYTLLDNRLLGPNT